jgi:hypothetical protein
MRKLLVLAFAAAMLPSCSPPPFNADMLLTAYVTGKMRKEAVVGTERFVGDSTEWEGIFYPTRILDGAAAGVDCGRGVAQFWNSGGSELHFAYPGVEGYASFGFPQGYYPPYADPFAPVSLVAPLKNGDCTGVFVIVPNEIENSGALFYRVNAADRTISGIGPWPDTFWNFLDGFGITDADRIVGLAVPVSSDPLQDRCFILASHVSLNEYMEFDAGLDNINGLMSPVNHRTIDADILWFLNGSGYCRYFHDLSSDASFICLQSGKTWRTYRVTGSGVVSAVELPRVTSRIDALLSTGELFSTENGIARVFSRDDEARERASFPLYDLKFAGEAFSDGAARVYFTQSFVTDSLARFMVYSIPTEDLDTLDAQ